MTEVKRYTPSLKPGLMIEDAEGKWAKYEVLAQVVAKCEDLQQRLNAADERADMLEKAAKEMLRIAGIANQGSNAYNRAFENLHYVLKPAEGRGDVD